MKTLLHKLLLFLIQLFNRMFRSHHVGRTPENRNTPLLTVMIGEGMSAIVYTLAPSTPVASITHVLTSLKQTPGVAASATGTALTVTFANMNATATASLVVNSIMTLTAQDGGGTGPYSGIYGNGIAYTQAAPNAAVANITVTESKLAIVATPGGKGKITLTGITGAYEYYNGDYFYVGQDAYGRPWYTKSGTTGDASFYIRADETNWNIGDQGFWATKSGYPTPDLVPFWIPKDGATGTPVLTPATSTQAQVIAAINAHISISAMVGASASGTVTGPAGTFSKTFLSGGEGTPATAEQVVAFLDTYVASKWLTLTGSGMFFSTPDYSNTTLSVCGTVNSKNRFTVGAVIPNFPSNSYTGPLVYWATTNGGRWEVRSYTNGLLNTDHYYGVGGDDRSPATVPHWHPNPTEKAPGDDPDGEAYNILHCTGSLVYAALAPESDGSGACASAGPIILHT